MSAPSQPSNSDVYETAGNAVSKEPAEAAAARRKSQDTSQRGAPVPTKQTSSSDEATPSSLGRGIQGAPAGEEAQGE
jgi:hypothetical protein